MADLTVRDQAIEAYVTYISVKSGHSKDVARAFVNQFTPSNKCKNMDSAAKDKMVNWIRSNYFPLNAPSPDVDKAITTLVCDAYGKLAKHEVVEAMKLAAASRLADVSLDAPLTPQLIGKVLKAYEMQQRQDLIKAYYAAEMERQKQASQTGYVHLTEADMHYCRSTIVKYAEGYEKNKQACYGHWMDYINPLLDAGAIEDLSEEAKIGLRRNAESAARVWEYQYRQARGRQGFVGISAQIDMSINDVDGQFRKLYAHELIIKNREYFKNQFKP